MFGVLINVLTVVVGALVGLLFKKGIPERVSKAAMIGLGVCTLYIGISGSLCGENVLIIIASVVLGAICGTLLDIDGAVNRLATKVEGKFRKEGQKTSLAEGFVSSTLLFCVGSMTIVGSIQSGLLGNHDLLYTKSMLDFVSSIILSSTMGVGVLLSSAFVLVFQGGIALVSYLAGQGLSAAVIDTMSSVGSVLIVGLGLNVMGVTKLKIMNYLPAVFFPIALVPLWDWIVGLIVK
jgi:uncharacterized membrane protein YqgA involved in biofilm formation